MKRNLERIERYLSHIEAPRPAPELDPRPLRQRLLADLGGRADTVSMPGRFRKIAAAAVIVVCAGGLVGAVVEMKHRPAGRASDGASPYLGRDANSGMEAGPTAVHLVGNQVEKPVKGRPLVFTREQFTLRNGVKVILSKSEPNEAPQPARQPGKETP